MCCRRECLEPRWSHLRWGSASRGHSGEFSPDLLNFHGRARNKELGYWPDVAVMHHGASLALVAHYYVSIEQSLRALYDRVPDGLQLVLRDVYHRARIRLQAIGSRLPVGRAERSVFVEYDSTDFEQHEFLGPGR